MHVVKALVDVLKGLVVSHKFVNPQLAIQVVLHDTRKLGSTLDTSKGGSLPRSSSDQLEAIPSVSFSDRCNVMSTHGRVEISAPAGATPMMLHTPQPLWQHSRAARMTPTFPVASKVKSSPPSVSSTR